MNARILEAKRLLLGDDRLEVYLEEHEDGIWHLHCGPGVGDKLHLSVQSRIDDAFEPPPTMSLKELLYKAELFDHMVDHLQDQMVRSQDHASDEPNDNTTSQLALYAKVGVCTQGLSEQALEAMVHEFQSENHSQSTMSEIAAWARDVLAIRRERLELALPGAALLVG